MHPGASLAGQHQRKPGPKATSNGADGARLDRRLACADEAPLSVSAEAPPGVDAEAASGRGGVDAGAHDARVGGGGAAHELCACGDEGLVDGGDRAGEEVNQRAHG